MIAKQCAFCFSSQDSEVCAILGIPDPKACLLRLPGEDDKRPGISVDAILDCLFFFCKLTTSALASFVLDSSNQSDKLRLCLTIVFFIDKVYHGQNNTPLNAVRPLVQGLVHDERKSNI